MSAMSTYRSIKSVFVVMFTIFLIMSPLTVFADYASSQPAIIASSVQAKPGDTISVDISLQNNPGFAAMMLDVSFDCSVLTLDSIVYGDEFTANGEQPQFKTSPVRLSWSNTKNATGDGPFATLNFTVNSALSETTESEISVSYSKGNICDIFEEDVSFVCQNGIVAVDFDAYTIGDANNDNVFNVLDLVHTMRYLINNDVVINVAATDVNRDNIINLLDLVVLLKKLSSV